MTAAWWPLWLAVLGVTLAVLALAPFAAYFPPLARLTGAAPLDKEEKC